jgi:hypothetical protein
MEDRNGGVLALCCTCCVGRKAVVVAAWQINSAKSARNIPYVRCIIVLDGKWLFEMGQDV